MAEHILNFFTHFFGLDDKGVSQVDGLIKLLPI